MSMDLFLSLSINALNTTKMEFKEDYCWLQAFQKNGSYSVDAKLYFESSIPKEVQPKSIPTIKKNLFIKSKGPHKGQLVIPQQQNNKEDNRRMSSSPNKKIENISKIYLDTLVYTQV